jgi:hypothetical protein
MQVMHRLIATDPVRRQTDVALEVVEGPRRQWAEDAVDPPGVEPQPAESALEFADVVAPQVGGAVVQHAIAERPAGLDESPPRLPVAASIDM